MGNFSRQNRFKGGRGDGKTTNRGYRDKRSSGNNGFVDRKTARDFRDQRVSRQVTFQAVCSECHKECGVPFKPNGSKPVLCSVCFKQGRKGFDNLSPSRKFSERRLERPRSNDGYTEGVQNRSSEKTDRQLEIMNAKLDEILSILKSKDTVSVEIDEEIKEEVKEKVKKVKKTPSRAENKKEKKTGYPKKGKTTKKK